MRWTNKPLARRQARLVLGLILAATLLLLTSGGSSVQAAEVRIYRGQPTPYDNERLILCPPGSFVDTAKGAPAVSAAVQGDNFAGKAVLLTQPVKIALEVKHAGKYTLWARVGQRANVAATVVNFAIAIGETVLLSGQANGPGKIGIGGRPWQNAFTEQARQAGSAGTLVQADEVADKLADELAHELGDDKEQATHTWTRRERVENLAEDVPFYWWRLGEAALPAGPCTLTLTPQKQLAPDKAPLLNVAILTTWSQAVYPFVGDLNAPRSYYVRFRIDELPANGQLNINYGLSLHGAPWYTARQFLGPTGAGLAPAPHRQTGYTSWYCLQDVESAPRPDGGDVSLTISLSGPARGETQFAAYPHQDQVLRRIPWDEPDGLAIAFWTDLLQHPERIQTFRDRERENYERALHAGGGKLYPLARGNLHFANGWGQATGAALDYMTKALRLLGMNATACGDALANRQRYGWRSAGGEYWPPVMMPFDEEKALAFYDNFYRGHFADQELMRGTSVFQVADEPGEISRSEMSAPLWRWEAGTEQPYWLDPVGESVLATARSDYQDCVLEGKVTTLGFNFSFRAGMDDPRHPKQFVQWTVGVINREAPKINLLTLRAGADPIWGTRPGSTVAGGPTPFKIVYQGGTATLYINGQLIHQHSNVPRKGGFAFLGPSKAIFALEIRAAKKGEGAAAAAPAMELRGEDEGINAELSDMGLEGTAAAGGQQFTPKPLKQFVEEDWVWAGGIEGAPEAFRQWAQKRGMKPQEFGYAQWDKVPMLTLPSLVRTPEEARLFYASRQYSGYLTPRMFAMAAQAMRRHAPNHEMTSFVALSGHALSFPSALPLDMFELGRYPDMTPGISDWMSLGGWRWDGEESVAFSIAPSNSGARRYGQQPISFPMMHCVWPNMVRSYTQLGSQCRLISYWNYGPSYAVTEGYWSDSPSSYRAVSLTDNRAAQLDDLLGHSTKRPSPVALLYAMSNEYWNPQSSFTDKRATYLALLHGGFEPDMVNEQQVEAGELSHYQVLYVLDPIVTQAAQKKIAEFVRQGGTLWLCADALQADEFNQPSDTIEKLAGLTRTYPLPSKTAPAAQQAAAKPPLFKPAGNVDFRPHRVQKANLVESWNWPQAATLGAYDDGRPAWQEKPVDKGRVLYLAHRGGLSHTALAVRYGGIHTLWPDTGRTPITWPIQARQLTPAVALTQPRVLAFTLDAPGGSVVLLVNLNQRPVERLEVGLVAKAPIVAASSFDENDLLPLQATQRDGRFWVTLEKPIPPWEGQMVAFRTAAAPADERLAEMQQRTVAQLGSTDVDTLSAGAWFAGFYADWSLGEKLLPLLQDSHWQVRRAAAESLGRLKFAAGADALVAAAGKEKDVHCLADELAALVQVKPQAAWPLSGKLLGHEHPLVRLAAIRALRVLATPGGAAPGAFANDPQALPLCRQALPDPSPAVRKEAIALLAQLDPPQAVRSLVAAMGDPAAAADRAAWVAAVAASPPAVAAYVQAGLPGPQSLLIQLATAAIDPGLTAGLQAIMTKIEPANAHSYSWAVMHQRDEQLVRALWAARKSLPAQTAYDLIVILDATFPAHLGMVFEDWEAYLAK